MKAMKVLLIALILAPMSAWANMAKVDREDFSQLITDGMKASSELSKEIRKNLGVAPDRHEQALLRKDIKTKVKIEMGQVAEVSSPTTKYVRSRPVTLDLEDLNERRLAEEFQQSGY